MTHDFASTALFACALFTAACTQAPATVPAPPDTREADAKNIRDVEDAWNKEFEAKACRNNKYYLMTVSLS